MLDLWTPRILHAQMRRRENINHLSIRKRSHGLCARERTQARRYIRHAMMLFLVADDCEEQ